MTFRRAAEIHWLRQQGDVEWGRCEDCGVAIHRLTVPHHVKGAQGGLGGRRKHTPDLLRHLCRPCHDAQHF